MNKEQLLDLSKNIKDVESLVRKLRLDEVSTSDGIKSTSEKTLAQITDMVDANNKPVYSNNTKRQAKLIEVLTENKEYQSMTTKLELIKEDIIEKTIELSHLKRVFDIELQYAEKD